MVISNISYFHPYLWKMIRCPFLTNIFSKGLVQPPTRDVFFPDVLESFSPNYPSSHNILVHFFIWFLPIWFLLDLHFLIPFGHVKRPMQLPKQPRTRGSRCSRAAKRRWAPSQRCRKTSIRAWYHGLVGSMAVWNPLVSHRCWKRLPRTLLFVAVLLKIVS